MGHFKDGPATTMAEVPNMNSSLMHSYSDNEEEFYKECTSTKKNTLKDLYGGYCTSGVRLEITKQRKSPYSVRKTVVLVRAVEKLKRKKGKQNVFSDTDLLDLLNNSVVEEKITYINSEFLCGSESENNCVAQGNYRITDSSHRCLVLKDFQGVAKLVAVHLQGPNTNKEEKIKMELCVLNSAEKQPVALGLLGRNLYLSCVSAEGAKELRLEEVSNIRNIGNDDLKHFLFLTNNSSKTKISFESAAFPGWYISTSKDDDVPLQMTEGNNQQSQNEFDLFE